MIPYEIKKYFINNSKDICSQQKMVDFVVIMIYDFIEYLDEEFEEMDENKTREKRTSLIIRMISSIIYVLKVHRAKKGSVLVLPENIGV